MKKEIDIHNYTKRLERAIKLVARSEISDRNKKLIMDFREFCSIERLSIARIERYLGILKDWAVLLERDFDKATKEEIMKAVRVIQEHETYSPWTKATYKVMLKRFYKWLKGTGENYPEEVAWIDAKVKKTERKTFNYIYHSLNRQYRSPETFIYSKLYTV